MSTPPDPQSLRVLIVGATSAIAGETARAFATYGGRLVLVGRDSGRLSVLADDLRVRGATQVESLPLDLTDIAGHAETVAGAFAPFDGLDVALVAHGTLPDQAKCEASVPGTLAAMEVNFTATVAMLTLLANRFEAQRHGCIAVITSVAGDRGRPSNYVYGAAKGGVDRFLQGLRGRLHRSGVAVLTVKPGLVDTPMTAGMRKHPLFTDPERVGRAIHRAVLARRSVVYVPWFWRPIMLVITHVPESLFRRLKL